ncbi:DUF4062 domain-containing protein [Bacillus sp. BAU-SS-2023]|nr:DUF4062 domain-containing protein [Bacillus sp. BAU-SS-2023]
MAGMRVFISSTCYDLNILRSQLRVFCSSLGYEPMMSDFNDILYDPRIHTHTSCVDEVSNCDILILIIGARFGGQAVPEAVDKINFDEVEKNEINVEVLKKQDKISITQLEVLKAIEESIPVYTFIEQKVWHDHQLYQKNKNKDIIKQIDFPSIDKQDTAEYIFEFINFVRLRSKGNNIFTFNKIDDIENVLKKQWSSYFQRLLSEQRYNYIQGKRIENLTDQFEDLKTAILTSIGTNNQKDIAMGVVKYRKLFEFFQGLRIIDFNTIKLSTLSWDDLLKDHGIVEILDCREIEGMRERGPMGRGCALVKGDDTFYLCRYSIEVINELSLDWETFTKLNNDTRDIIADALSEIPNRGILMSYFREGLDEYIDRKRNKYSVSEYVAME